VALFEQALAIDPNYAAAWAWLSTCHTRRVGEGMDTTGAGYAKATQAAERALALDPAEADAYVALAVARMQYNLDWAAAAEALAKARAIDPNNPQLLLMSGHHMQATGRLSEAIALFRRAAELDPLNMVPVKYLGKALYYRDRLPEAESVLRGGIRLNPQFPSLSYELGVTLLLRGDRQAALAAIMAEPAESWRSFGMPLGYHALHRDREAEAALDELLRNSTGSEFQVAEAYAYVGRADKAFEWLEKARTLHDPGLMWVRRDPILASVFGDRRYPAFLARIGLTMPPQDD
jgi:tetratricopeptide (TPR) repeat protein